MITLNLDWHEVLWWLRGGMSGSHLCWDVYSDMVDKVWKQCSESERKNLFWIMRRDFGYYWRPDDWNGFDNMEVKGEGPWKPESEIFDKTPWMYFRQVLACYDPDNQYAVTMQIGDNEQAEKLGLFKERVISHSRFPKHPQWTSSTATAIVRTYKWDNEYRVSWTTRCAEDTIVKVEKLNLV